jgi:hypothetical protein
MLQHLAPHRPAMIIRPHPSGDWEVLDESNAAGVLSSLDVALETSLYWIRRGGRVELRLSHSNEQLAA